MAWVRFPHTFSVYKIEPSGTFPPTETETEVVSGICSVQTKSEINKNEAMLYDYVLYTKAVFPEHIKATYKVVCQVGNATIEGIIVRAFEGQLTNRIWFNEISK